jgi:hypothetical protein
MDKGPRGVCSDRLDSVLGAADGNIQPVFVSPEFGERDPVWGLQNLSCAANATPPMATSDPRMIAAKISLLFGG